VLLKQHSIAVPITTLNPRIHRPPPTWHDNPPDPRNLLLVFELVQLVASSPSLHPLPTSLVEELFNATFCYFPIRFKRAASDAGSVSPDVLAVKLRDALFSSTVFAPFLCMGLSQRIAGEDEDDDVYAALQVVVIVTATILPPP
jgi:hypothetical protein